MSCDGALSDFDRGEFFSPEASRTDIQKRKPAWLNDRKR
jgi:hypothetical protein